MDVEIRTYELQEDGDLEPHSIMPLSYYHGICPQVGDTLCDDLLPAGPQFYEVQRRFFFDTNGAGGWAIIVRRLDATLEQTKIYKAWNADTDFWGEADEPENDAMIAALLERLGGTSITPRSSSRKPKKRSDE